MSGRVVNFGLWYDFRNPAPENRSFERLYAESLEQITWAESLGFDSIWLTEHHFCEDGYTPSPLVIAGAIGQVTTKMRIGTNLMLLPLADPIRLAEDSATLAILTGGRFDLGVGLGYRELEFDYFGRKLSHRPSLMEEGVELLRKAWSGETIRHHGRRFQVDGLRVAPVADDPPRLFMGGMSEPAIARAARLGDGFLSTGGIGHDLYVAAMKNQESPRSGGAICAGNWGIIAEDPEAEADRIGEYVLYQANQYVSWGAFGPPDQVPLFPDKESAVREGLYELWDADRAVTALVKMLAEYPEIIDVHFWAQFPGESVESGSRRMEYIAREVLPRVREQVR
ncbi:MAG: LLM class flavin-dependent oxidoreductase [Myxococcota bacterium]|nr:LLM class flavin-dependent oxidoreductase [Myxococcota bacterium]